MNPSRLSPHFRLAVLGLLSLAAYGWLAWRYPLAEHLQWPRGGWYEPQGAVVSNLWVHLAVYVLLFAAYWAAIWEVGNGSTQRGKEAKEQRNSLTQRRGDAETWGEEGKKGRREDQRSVSTRGGGEESPAEAQRRGEKDKLRSSASFSVPQATLLVVVVVWLVASAVLLWVTPSGDSHDIYDYVYRGRLQVEEGVSPLAVTPKEAPRMAYYAFTAWKEHVDTYGPLWEYASAGTTWLVNRWLDATGGFPPDRAECSHTEIACRALMAWVTGYRLLAIGLVGLSGWLIYRLVAGERPEWALAGLLVWLWNPAVLLSSALGAHNDGLMLVFLLLCFWAAQRRRWAFAYLLLGLAAHVKLTALMWAPLLGLWMWRQIGFRRALLAGIGGAALLLPLSWLLYQPLGGWETLPRMLSERVLYVANSPSQFVDRLLPELGYRLNKEFVRFWIIRVPTYAFAVLGVGVPAWLVWRNRLAGRGVNPQLWALALIVSMLYLTVGSFWFQHWYLLWAILPAVLLPWSRFTRWVLPAVCFGPVAANIIADTYGRLAEMILTRVELTGVVVAVIWLPGLLAGVWALWQWRREARTAL